MIASYPEVDEEWLRAEVGAMEIVIETIRAVRNVRADLNLPPTAAVELLVFGDGADRLAPHESYVRRLAGVATVAYANGGERPKGAATASSAASSWRFRSAASSTTRPPRSPAIASSSRSSRRKCRRVASKLANPQFLERAPAEIIEKEREKQRELVERRAALERNVERLSAL